MQRAAEVQGHEELGLRCHGRHEEPELQESLLHVQQQPLHSRRRGEPEACDAELPQRTLQTSGLNPLGTAPKLPAESMARRCLCASAIAGSAKSAPTLVAGTMPRASMKGDESVTIANVKYKTLEP